MKKILLTLLALLISSSANAQPNLAAEMGNQKNKVAQKEMDTASRYSMATIYLCKYRDENIKVNFDWYLAFESPCNSKMLKNQIDIAKNLNTCVFRSVNKPLSKSFYPDSNDKIFPPNLPGGNTVDFIKVDSNEEKYTWQERGMQQPEIFQLDTKKNIIYYKKDMGGGGSKITEHKCSKIK